MQTIHAGERGTVTGRGWHGAAATVREVWPRSGQARTLTVNIDGEGLANVAARMFVPATVTEGT